MNISNPTGLIVLAVLALGSAIVLLRNSDSGNEADASLRLGIGYYMKRASLIGTGDDGAVLYRLNAESVTQNIKQGAVDLVDVHVIYDPETEVAWDLRADTGHMPPDSSVVQLIGNVVASTIDEIDSPMTIRTEFLELDIETYTADTPRRVTLDQEANRVVATGMRADFKADRLQLLADVNGKFIP